MMMHFIIFLQLFNCLHVQLSSSFNDLWINKFVYIDKNFQHIYLIQIDDTLWWYVFAIQRTQTCVQITNRKDIQINKFYEPKICNL
jgi:hypothetical protein